MTISKSFTLILKKRRGRQFMVALFIRKREWQFGLNIDWDGQLCLTVLLGPWGLEFATW